jgi:hypothetical protein
VNTALLPDPPLAHRGQLLLGPSQDGSEYATYNLFDTVRAHHGLLLCDDFERIWNLVTSITVAARASHPIHTIYLANHHYTADDVLPRSASAVASNPSEHDDMLAKLENVIRQREEFAAQHRFRSTIGQLPLLHVVLDGADQIIHNDTSNRWRELTWRGGKLGVAILAAVHTSSALHFARHSDLCSNLARANAIAIGKHFHGYVLAYLGLGDISDLGNSAGRLRQPDLPTPITFQPFEVPDRARVLAQYPDAPMDEHHRNLLDKNT